jgi:hemerythrin-like metal-binding protein
MNIIEWSDDNFLLGVDIMDNTHKEFITLLNLLLTATDTEFPELFNELVMHTEQHFMQEEKLMLESKFPAYIEHNSEHQRILGELNQFKKRVDKGQITFARNYTKDFIPGWFRTHAATMDSALAAHLHGTSQLVEIS